jgi:RNA recognition motif-containing protein
MNIYVGNINFKMSEEALRDVFEHYGEVSSVKIIKDKMSGRSKGFAFIEMENEAEANEAINSVNGTEHMGKVLVVNVARPKTANTQNRPRFNKRTY